MPQTWQMVDSNFPTITGQEPITEQISKIIDYLAILTEQLQYQLQNLDSSNWNASALENFTEDTTTQFGKKVAALSNQVSALQATVSNLAARVSGAENLAGRVQTAEEMITGLQEAINGEGGAMERITQTEEEISLLQQELDGEQGVKARLTKTEEENTKMQEGFDDLQLQLNGAGGYAQRLSAVEQMLGIEQEGEGESV